MRAPPQAPREMQRPIWQWSGLFAVVVITSLCFLNAIGNDFTNWDDPQYVIDNPLIRELSFANLRAIFSSFLVGNYHPLTVLSLALDYASYGPTPRGFHLTSILLHLGNVVLVFVFIRRLVGSHLVALLTAMLFGIHPMHVESVAWITERKDVLYVFFYLASVCTYLVYIDGGAWKRWCYGASLGLFLCSLLSKGQAVTLPVVLLLIDYARDRRLTIGRVVEKVPFFLLSIVFGVVAIVAQKDTGAIPEMPRFSLPERILFAFPNICLYVAKLVAPIKLSAFYPYPSAELGVPYLLCVVAGAFVLGIIALNSLGLVTWFVSLRRGTSLTNTDTPVSQQKIGRAARLVERLPRSHMLLAFVANRIVVFGCAFFWVNIALLLQVLPVGASMISERYSYLSSAGLFLLIAYGVGQLWGSERADTRTWRPVVAVVFLAYSTWLGIATIQRNTVWRNSESLWSDVIEQFPRVPLAYLNRGSYYQTIGQPERALADFNAGLALNPNHFDILVNRCDVFRMLRDYDRSLADCTRVIDNARDYTAAYTNRGITYSMMGRVDEALVDFNSAIALEPTNAKLYSNRGNVYDMSGKYDTAIENYSKAISLSPDYFAAYYNRGKTKIRKGDLHGAIADFEVAARSRDYAADSYFYRSQCYRLIGDVQRALTDAYAAQRLGRVVDPRYIEELQGQ